MQQFRSSLKSETMQETSEVIKVSAPGKIIFFGEHAVVYGKPAVAASLSLRTHVSLTPAKDFSVTMQFYDIGVNKSFSCASIHNILKHNAADFKIDDPIPASEELVTSLKTFCLSEKLNIESKEILGVVAFLYLYYNIMTKAGDLHGVLLSVKTDIPVGAGFGSSGSFSTVLSAALLQWCGFIQSSPGEDVTVETWSPVEKELISKWAFIGDKVIHGQPSGVDNTVSTYGGAIKFEKKDANPISPLDKMPELSIMLVNTRVPRSTKVLVDKFGQRCAKYPDVCEPILQSLEAIANRSVQLFHQLASESDDDCYCRLNDLIDLNQQLLNSMGVGHPSLDQIVSLSAKYELHAKLTGAGGGGCAFVLLPPGTDSSKLDNLKVDLENFGFCVWLNVGVGGAGVCRHI